MPLGRFLYKVQLSLSPRHSGLRRNDEAKARAFVLAQSGVIHVTRKGGKMANKLQQGDRFPTLDLKLVSGETIRLPNEMPGRYAALLFYRGHW